MLSKNLSRSFVFVLLDTSNELRYVVIYRKVRWRTTYFKIKKKTVKEFIYVQVKLKIYKFLGDFFKLVYL